jgi:penicillin-binding protein 2
VTRRTLRHPFRGDRLYLRANGSGRGRGAGGRGARQARLRFRRRRSVNVAALVASPEEVPSRPRLRINVIAVIVFGLFAVMVLRLWSLQVIDHRQYAAAVNTNTLRTVTVPAPRGLIVDRDDTVLAGNRVENELVLSRVEARADPSIVGRVAALAGISPATVQAALTDQEYSPYEPVPVLQDAPAATVQYLDAHQSEFPGVSVQQVTVRQYPQGGTLGTQVLGYTGPITATYLKQHPHAGYTQESQIGKTGVEDAAQQYLGGKPGKEDLEVNPTGTVIGTERETKPVQGDTIVTNITAGLQRYVQSALATDIANDRARVTTGIHPAAPNGAAVVLNARTGAVLALTSYPSYSLTEWVGGISTADYQALQGGCTVATGACPLNDYATQGLYTPGSTFKLATATAALQDGLIGTTTTIDDTGVFDVRAHGDPTCISGCTFHDATAYDAGIITIRLALTESDDFFFYTMGLQFWLDRGRYGNTAIQNVAHEYGIGQSTGIDLPGEVAGRVDSQPVREELHKVAPTAFPTTSWYAGDNIEMAFGQGETVLTPIEEAQAYATFADGGVRHQPEVVGAVVTPGGKAVQTVAPKVTGHVAISPGDYQAMLTGFEGVTHTPKGTAYGTFQQYSHVPSTYVIAGKTGTATTGTTKVKAPNAWFVGFGPIQGPTEYVVVVAVAQAGYGADAAAPAVANIFNYLYANPVSPSLRLPTAAAQPSTTTPPTVPPAGTPTTTTTTTSTTAGTTASTSTTAPTTTSPTTTTPKTSTTGGAGGTGAPATTTAKVVARGGRAPP